jgi:ADP-heptose:LPS heptosyltransferase
VQRDDADIRPFEGEHPEVMRDHPLAGQKRHCQVKRPESIVYVEHSGIGNLILATPMLQAIRAAKPNCQLHVITWKRAARIIEGAPFLDSVTCIEDRNCMSQFMRGVDHLLISPVGAVAQFVHVMSQVSRKVHKLNTKAPWTQHEAEVKMQLARRLGFRGPPPKCYVPWFEYNRHAAIMAFPEYMDKEQPERWVAINAAYLKSEHWYKKHWGDMKFGALIDMIHEKFPTLGFVFVGGEIDKGDADRAFSYTEKVPEHFVVNRCGYSDDIKDTAAILSGCVLCIGNDGGLQHIAAAVGKPTVTIFTFTNPVKNRPFYADLTEKSGKVVMKPCQKRLMCQHGNHDQCECLDVPIGPVFASVEAVLQEVLNGGNKVLRDRRGGPHASSDQGILQGYQG